MTDNNYNPLETDLFYQFRVILIGDSTVGKSSLLRQFTEGQYIRTSDPTVGVDFHVRVIQISDKVRVKLQLWDTAGQERFRSITRSYYRNCAGCLIVYDINNRESFNHVSEWLREAKYATEDLNVVYSLVGHKLDLDYLREVPTSEGEAFALANDMLFIETSAKILCNVEEAFSSVAREIYKRFHQGSIRQNSDWEGVKKLPSLLPHIYLREESGDVEQRKKCCH
ncbi:ras-related protein Rab-39B [Hydra vulgaris]|uniref:Ras-related protein Rab-39B n=1 Tax=Hydra vulgaris TaxID=6087 RepID=T2M8B3_HYDVU|nr:ras-related protein Rab-39B [Hydra vulgaris]